MTFSTFQDLIDYIEVPRDNYYETLLINAELILRAYRTRTQAELGACIGMNQTQVSILIKLLTAHTSLV